MTGGHACLRARCGAVLPLHADRWLRPPGPEEQTLLYHAIGPVLDVGCGPARHVVSLGHRGVPALGIDVAPGAVRLAHDRGALALRRSVFDHVPAAGRWRTALLVDGNVGIGGEPVSLLRRLADLLCPDGRVLAEVDGPGRPSGRHDVRVETDDGSGPWFAWAVLGVDAVYATATAAGFAVVRRWEAGGRWFVHLDRC